MREFIHPSRSSAAASKACISHRAFRLLNDFGWRSNKEYRKQRHALWNCLWALHLGIISLDRFLSRTTLKAIRDAFDEFESRSLWGRKARAIARKTVKAVCRAFRQARRGDLERWTPNNFFKSK